MDRLRAILEDTLSSYAGEALNGHLYLTKSNEDALFSIMSIAKVRNETIIETGIVARIIADTIIIEEDINNKPLVDALVQNGIDRQQIVLAYAGEAIPTTG